MTEQEFTSLGAARVDEEELAEAVRTYPILYVKSIKEFKDQKKKNRVEEGCSPEILDAPTLFS